MLAKAAERVENLKLPRKALSVMDAGRLAFAGESFDAAAVMYVMTVVPDPAAVMAEMWRVLRPGGMAIVVNHFSRERGPRAAAEQWLARSRRLGWHPVFPLKTVTGAPGFRLVEMIDLPPFGLFTLSVFRRSSKAYPLLMKIKSGYALAFCFIVRLIGKPLHTFPDALCNGPRKSIPFCALSLPGHASVRGQRWAAA